MQHRIRHLFAYVAGILWQLGPSRILTLVLAPCFIAYGVCIAILGYHSPFIHVLGLPVVYYAGLFFVAGVIKMVLMFMGRAQVAHTISVAVATFWFMAIFIFAPGATGALQAIPWIALALVSMFGAIWPEPPRLNLFSPTITPDDTNPAMRAIDYVSNSKVRTVSDADKD
jgi:hypothetical protein